MEAEATQQALHIEGTRQAISLQATATAQADTIRATQTVAAAQAEARRRDSESMATAVAGKLEATRTALALAASQQAARVENAQRIETAVTVVGMMLLAAAGAIGVWLLIRLARSTALHIRRSDAAQAEATDAAEVIEMVQMAERDRQRAAFYALWQMQNEMVNRRALGDADKGDTRK